MRLTCPPRCLCACRPADLKPLYSSPSKAAALGQLFDKMLASLEAGGALPPLAGGAGGDAAEEQKPAPQALVWCVGPLGRHAGVMCDVPLTTFPALLITPHLAPAPMLFT